MSVEVPKSSIEVTDDEVRIASVDLANSLLTEQTIALEQLGEMVDLPTVRLSDISLDESGRVVIYSKAYVDAINKSEIGGAADRAESLSFNWKCQLK